MTNIVTHQTGLNEEPHATNHGLAAAELAIKQKATAHTTAASGKLYYGENVDGDSNVALRTFGIGILAGDDSDQSQTGVPIGGNMYFKEGSNMTITQSTSGDVVTLTFTPSTSATLTGAGSTIDTEDLTASRALVSNGSGKVAVSDVTATELGYLDGVSSAVQTQLDAKQASLTFGKSSGNALKSEEALTSNDILLMGSSHVKGRTYSQLKADLSLEIGTDVQAYDADLDNLSGMQSGASSALAAITSTELQILDGATVTTAELNILDGVTATASELNILDGVTGVTAAELSYIGDVTSAIQSQLDGKAATGRKLDDFGTPDDNTDLDATTSRHGLLPKLGGGTSNFLRADGSWATPSASVSANSIGADELNVSGDGSSGQVLTSDADGSFSWTAKTTNTDADVSVANLKTRLAGGFGSNAVTIGDSDDVVTIGGSLVVDELTINDDTITCSDDFIISAAGKDISFTDGSGTAEFKFNLEAAPELDVDGAFTIDCSSTMDIELGGDFTIKGNHETLFDDGSNGTIIEIDPVNAHFRIHDDAQTGNYFDIAVEANGATTISTVDTDAEAAHLTFDLDGDMIVDADNSDIIFKDGGTTRYTFNLDSTPSLVVGQTFKLDGSDAIEIESGGSADITLDSANDIILDAATGVFKFYDAEDTNDYLKMTVVGGTGATTFETVSAGADGHLKFEPDGSFLIKETGSAGADVGGYGQLWVKNDTPNELYFTTDAGDDIQITDGTSLAGGGGGSTNAAGSDTQVQFNDGGTNFGGSSNFIWDDTALKIASSSGGVTLLELKSTAATSSTGHGPFLDIRRDVTPSDGDELGRIRFTADSSSGGSKVYGAIMCEAVDVTNSSVEGKLTFEAAIGNSNTEIFHAGAIDTSGNEAVWPATDNAIDLGTSSLQWKDLYVDGTAYVDAINADGAAGLGTGSSPQAINYVSDVELISPMMGVYEINVTGRTMTFRCGVLVADDAA